MSTPQTSIPGARSLFIVLVVQAAALFASFVLFRVVFTRLEGATNYLAVLEVKAVAFLAVAAAKTWALATFSRGREGTRASGPARAAFVGSAVALAIGVFTMAAAWIEFVVPPTLDSALSGVEFVADTLAEFALIVAAARCLPALASWVQPTLLLVVVIRAIPWAVATFDGEAYSTIFRSPVGHAVGLALSVGSIALTAGVAELFRRVSRETGQVDVAARQEQPFDADAVGRDLLVGSLWLVGGGAITAYSYAFAAPGGRFMVAYGAVIYGGARVIRGVIRLSSAPRGE